MPTDGKKNPQRDVGAVQVNPLCTFRTSLNKGKFSSTLAWLQEYYDIILHMDHIPI